MEEPSKQLTQDDRSGLDTAAAAAYLYDLNRKRRKPNFTEPELQTLVELWAQYKTILRGPATDTVMRSTKARVWRKITDEMNRRYPFVLRRVCDIRGKWEKLMCEARACLKVRGLQPCRDQPAASTQRKRPSRILRRIMAINWPQETDLMPDMDAGLPAQLLHARQQKMQPMPALQQQQKMPPVPSVQQQQQEQKMQSMPSLPPQLSVQPLPTLQHQQHQQLQNQSTSSITHMQQQAMPQHPQQQQHQQQALQQHSMQQHQQSLQQPQPLQTSPQQSQHHHHQQHLHLQQNQQHHLHQAKHVQPHPQQQKQASPPPFPIVDIKEDPDELQMELDKSSEAHELTDADLPGQFPSLLGLSACPDEDEDEGALRREVLRLQRTKLLKEIEKLDLELAVLRRQKDKPC